MACILIDYENNGGKALDGISLLKLRESDELVFFYSKNARNMTMELHKELEKVSAKKIYIKVKTGESDALDFQLSSYLGACIYSNPDKKYYIVSEDKGFESVCSFWHNKNIFVERIDRIFYCSL